MVALVTGTLMGHIIESFLFQQLKYEMMMMLNLGVCTPQQGNACKWDLGYMDRKKHAGVRGGNTMESKIKLLTLLSLYDWARFRRRKPRGEKEHQLMDE